jgi:hypothetical protein
MPLPTKEQLEELKQRIEANRPQAARVAPGTYRGRVIRIDEKKSRKTNLPMLSVDIRLFDLPERPKLHRFIMQEGAGSWIYLDFLQALAFVGEDQQTDTDDLLNRVCHVQVVDEKQEDGSVRSVVKKFLRPEPEDGTSSSYTHPEAAKAAAQAKADDLNYGENADADADDIAAQAKAAALKAQALAAKAAAVAALKKAQANGESTPTGETPAADPAADATPQESDHLSESRRVLSHLQQKLKERKNA